MGNILSGGMDSRYIAKRVGNEHRTVMRLIREYREALNEVGDSPIKINKLKTKGRPAEYYMLDEGQVYLLITLMDNSERVMKLKAQLVKDAAVVGRSPVHDLLLEIED